jgi:protein phosphatase
VTPEKEAVMQLHPQAVSPWGLRREVEAIRWNAGGATDCGIERSRNEDQFLVAELGRELHVLDSSLGFGVPPPAGRSLLLAVADGMGGMGHGDVASAVALEALVSYVAQNMPSRLPYLDATHAEVELRRVIAACERGVHAAAQARDESAHQMGTTLTAAFVAWPILHVLHVGDSRCYLARRGEIRLLTSDHTLANQLRQHGSDSADEFDHVLVNSIGGDTAAVPEVHQLTLAAGDVIVLTSDGVTRTLDPSDIRAIIQQESRAEACARRIVGEARHRRSPDNATAVVARF